MSNPVKEMLVSVRIPSSLIKELKTITKKNHFLDLSETIRSIVRHKCMAMMDPYSEEMKKFRKQMSKELLQKAKTKTDLIQDLKRITEELAHE